MPETPAHLSVCIGDKVAMVRVTGRANFNYGVAFKKLMCDLRDRGCDRIVLDLTACLSMDSTFLGVLAGQGFKSAEKTNGAPNSRIELLNPNQRVADLLDNLGVGHLFEFTQCAQPTECFSPVNAAEAVTRSETSKTCLEAHKALMSANPDNVRKFKDVTQYFEEQLQKAEAKKQ